MRFNVGGKVEKLTNCDNWDRPSPIKSYPQKYDWSDNEMIRVLAPYLKQKSGGKIVEMGCGDSYWLSYFSKEYGYRVYGMDFSKKRLDRTRSNLNSVEVEGELIYGDFTDGIPEHWLRSFDIVYSAGTVEHFKPPAGLIKSFTRLLKDDGLMITITPHFKCVWGRLDSRLNKNSKNEHVWMDLNDLENEHKNSGLKVIHSEYFRCMDIGILNFSHYGRFHRIFYGIAIVMNLIFKGVTKVCRIKRFPRSLYTSIIVVAKR